MRRLAVLLALAACAPARSQGSIRGLHDAVGEPGSQPRSDDPDAPSTDLAALRAVVGAARIVGLGHPGTGARELPRLHHRFVRDLVEGSGFTGLALDTDATAALALDRFVRGAALDLDAALLALGDRGLATRELADLLRWMQRHNAAHGPVLRVFGLDPRDPEAAAAVVLAYLERAEPAYVPEARSLLTGGQQLGVDVVLARLDGRRRDYLVAVPDADAWAEARQQAEVVAQARRMAETWEFEAGEFARARNSEWALAQLGAGGKLVVLADNRRVAAEVPGAVPSMGDFLRQWFAADYRVIGASFAGGAVLAAVDARTLCPVRLPAPRARSLDAALAELGLPIALVPLGADPALRRPQVLRSLVGARAQEQRLRPAVAFDAMLALRHVSAATPLGAAPHAASTAGGPCYTLPGE